MMKNYFAPMEGITGYNYRQVFHSFFGSSIDKYFAPFLAAGQEGVIKKRDLRDLSEQNNEGLFLVPQILSNQGLYTCRAIETIQQLGYQEINLNLGCPYGTVVSKKKGAGMLEDLKFLEGYLREVFQNSDLRISIKTRVGLHNHEEWKELLEIYNSFPVHELIVHPRTGSELYKGTPNKEDFAYAALHTDIPLIFNGNLFDTEGIREIAEQFPNTQGVMFGRGLLTNPALLMDTTFSMSVFQSFHDTLMDSYVNRLKDEKNTLFKMKEMWIYWQYLFTQPEKFLKKIRKAQDFVTYQSAIQQLYAACDFCPNGRYGKNNEKQ